MNRTKKQKEKVICFLFNNAFIKPASGPPRHKTPTSPKYNPYAMCNKAISRNDLRFITAKISQPLFTTTHNTPDGWFVGPRTAPLHPQRASPDPPKGQPTRGHLARSPTQLPKITTPSTGPKGSPRSQSGPPGHRHQPRSIKRLTHPKPEESSHEELCAIFVKMSMNCVRPGWVHRGSCDSSAGATAG